MIDELKMAFILLKKYSEIEEHFLTYENDMK
jgi:hypothetical protein